MLAFVSGHDPDGEFSCSPSYLQETAGPEIVAHLSLRGLDVIDFYYVDDAYRCFDFDGYTTLHANLLAFTDEWERQGTRIVVIAHSHGGVWASAAIYNQPAARIACTVLLDASSSLWSAGHGDYNDVIGFNPVSAFAIPPPPDTQEPVPFSTDDTGNYDMEDVVPMNVERTLEVRSGETAPFSSQGFDDRWNIRADGSFGGMFAYFSNTPHSEVHQPDGQTMTVVKSWLTDPNGCGL